MKNHREQWASHFGFLMSAAGSAIGLGTLWQFPYVTGANGGGIFVFIYICCILFVGIPVFIAELILGRKAQRAAVGIFAVLSNNSRLWKIGGWVGVISSILIMSYYSVVAGWGLKYIFLSITDTFNGLSAPEITRIFDDLSSSPSSNLFWHLAFTGLTLAVVYRGVKQGIEYWSKIMTTGLVVMLVALCCYTFTMDGFWQAFDFLLYPHYESFKPSGILEALGLAFFTLSLGQGIMLTYGSYMSGKEDIPKTGIAIGLMIVVVALLAGLMIFPIIFSFGFEPEGGPGLVFKTLPLLFTQLPATILISTVFFVLFVFAGLSSAIAFVEVAAANCIDLFGWSRKRAVIIIGVICFTLGIPSALSGADPIFFDWHGFYGKTFFETVKDLVSIWLLPIGGLIVTFFTGWILDKEIGKLEFESETFIKWMWRPWLFFVRWVAPSAIGAIILQESGLLNLIK